MNIAVRFAAFVFVETNSGCWLWSGALDPKGYGRFSRNNQAILAHRFSYEQHFGPIKDGLMVCHKCDVRCCVNPNHLFLGTAQDNTDDALRKDRLVRGSAVCNAKLTDAAVARIKTRLKTQYNSEIVGREFGVSGGTIRSIRRGKTWKRVQAAA